MAEQELYQELRDKLIKIETLLEQKFITTDIVVKNLESRVKKLEDSNTWLWRTIAGALIGAAIAFLRK